MIKKLLTRFNVHNKEDFWKLFGQFFKFCIVGLSNTAVSMGCYYLFLWINADLYMLGSIVGTILSIANAFFWNNRYVFKGNKSDAASVLKRLLKSYVAYGGTSILSNVLLWLEVSLIGISKLWAPVINLVITIPLNFVINKFWTFGKEKDLTEDAGTEGDSDIKEDK